MFRTTFALRRQAFAPLRRSYTTATTSEAEGLKQHSLAAAEKWKKISIYFCLPAIVFASYNAYSLWEHHKEHLKHHPRDETIYPYIDIHARDFPYGDGKHTAFFNPNVNRTRD